MFTLNTKAKKNAKNKTFLAPRRGWLKNEGLAGDIREGAEVLDNWFPTARGARMRKGCSKHATIGGAVTSMFSHKSGGVETMFAASATDIYDVTSPADADVAPSAAVSSLTGGLWSIAQFANSTADYLMCANGADLVRSFDGSAWATPSITGVTSSTISQLFVSKERIFMIEQNTLSFWYLAVNAIAGSATEFPLEGIFHLGGSLLFGTTWSLDSGSGLDDVTIFVTTEGEIAVYSGTDPSSSTTWSLVGVYKVGKPLNKNGFYHNGGDVNILCEDGIIPVSEAIQKSGTELQAASLTYNVEDAWRSIIANRSVTHNFTATLWDSQTMLMIGTPTVQGPGFTALVANSRTGAWSRYTGWDIQGATVINNLLYFGSEDTFVYLAESTGADNETEYAATWVPLFMEEGPDQKFAFHARFRGRGNENYDLGISAFSDYTIGSFTTVAAPADNASASIWDVGDWDVMVWGGGEYKGYVSQWASAKAIGVSIAPAVRVASNRAQESTLEATALDLMYEVGDII